MVMSLIVKRTKVMNDIFSLQVLGSSELSNETTIVYKIATVIVLLAKLALNRLDRFYCRKLGIRG